MRRGSLLQLIALTLVAFGIGAAVALLVPWLPKPASREAGRIWFTYWFATWICLVIFAGVSAVLVYSLLKFRAKPGDLSDGPPIHGHTTLEIVWTAIPFVLVTAIAIVSSIVLAKDGNAGSNPLRVTVTTMQFAYKFTYPNGQTFEVLRVPKDRHILLTLHSDDVIHSFWVPNWGQKSDAVPGLSNKLVVTPDTIGTYPIICTQLCGLGHALMRSEAIVMSPTSYAAWYKGTSTPAAAGTASTVATLFKTTATCGACHTFTPAGTKGTIGPNLDDLSAAAATAGQSLAAYVKQSLEDPDAYITPGYHSGVMSASCCKQLPPAEINELVQYLVTNTK